MIRRMNEEPREPMTRRMKIAIIVMVVLGLWQWWIMPLGPFR